MKMNDYYVSLALCLRGRCIKVQASNEDVVREWACEKLGAWCCVHKDIGDMEVIGEKYLGR